MLQIFDEYDEEVQAAEEAELQQGQVDSDKDIRPTHSKHSRHNEGGDGLDVDGEADNGGDDDDEELRVWNLRKCSAAALDMLSNSLGECTIRNQLLTCHQSCLTATGPAKTSWPQCSKASTPTHWMESYNKLFADAFACPAGDEHILPLLLPIVEQRLSDPDWRVRESAILALGAVSEGCHMGLAPYLTGMVQMLVPVLQVCGSIATC